MLRCLSAVAAMAMAMATHVSSATIDGAFSLDAQGLGNLIVTTLQKNINPGDVRLLIMQGLPPLAKSNAPAICDGAPALIAHLPGFPNNHCFEGTKGANITSNLSCSCLTYVAEDEWTFRLKKQTAAVTTPLPLYQDQEIDLEISSMMLYGVAPKVRKLNIIGVDDMQSIQLMPSPIPGASNLVALVFSASDSVFDTLYVENLSLADYDTKRGFIPSALTNVTIRNCNLTQLSTDLLEDLSKLTYLDVSHNRLEKIYQTVPDECPLRSLDVSFNNIPSFPESVLSIRSLQSLSLEGNPLGKSAINLTLYELLQKLNNLALQLDSGESNCSVGEVRPIGNTQICVNTTSSKPSDTSESSHTSTYLMYGVIGGCLVIAVLVFVLVKKNGCRSRDETHFTKEPLDGYFDETISYDDTHPTVSASLLNDPIIITNRIPYKDLRVANCISKGGFGLVYSGVYNRRRVAIKKIRPDRAGDIKQIESFLKEICLIATLNHPRVVEFIGVSWDSLRNLCAVTEFMERGDLREVLHGFKLRNTPLTWESHKTTIALHIAEGLTYLHSLSPKVIHRDLKSKNVLLNGEMHAKLSDFGISRERHLEETHMTAGIGTSFWIAPEVLLGKDYDERADIFSFGVVLSEIDTDDYPYWNASNPNVGNKAQENMILQMVASGAMRPSFSDSCPPAVLELADLCLQLDPENRPTAAEVTYRLQQMVQFANPRSSVSTIVM